MVQNPKSCETEALDVILEQQATYPALAYDKLYKNQFQK